MINSLPPYIYVIFTLTTVTTVYISYSYVRKSGSETISKKATVILFGQVLWLTIQGLVAYNQFYSKSPDSLPPRLLVFGIIPPCLLIAILFLTKNGRYFIDNLPLKNVLMLNIVRFPVEITLFLLYFHKAVPELMTFDGGNPDILSGITTPVLIYFGFKGTKIPKNLLLLWNVICLALLLNIVARALLSAPFPIQKLAFNQPDIAILNFPFTWLPVYIVPMVLFGHLTMIRQLLRMNTVKERSM
jgi:hypothetical protein